MYLLISFPFIISSLLVSSLVLYATFCFLNQYFIFPFQYALNLSAQTLLVYYTTNDGSSLFPAFSSTSHRFSPYRSPFSNFTWQFFVIPILVYLMARIVVEFFERIRSLWNINNPCVSSAYCKQVTENVTKNCETMISKNGNGTC